jgi:diguanylate cyclase (GGDEF)-like protein
LKTWVQKLLEQFEMDFGGNTKNGAGPAKVDMSEERATLLYIIDTYNKHLMDIEKRPVRKVRESLDEFAKQLVNPGLPGADQVLFKFRQFFASYRIDETTYVQNTFDDFKRIIWDFADNLGEDLVEQTKDREITASLEKLREAVEANSIDDLRAKSREFINFYMEHSTQREARRDKKMVTVRKNLDSVKKQLMEANHSMRVDHLTQAYNRKSFDEHLRRYIQLHAISSSKVSLIMLDIDHFKKVNDSYGHDIGDFVLKECVGLLKEVFSREEDYVARLGGEEFAVILPDLGATEAAQMAEQAMNRIRKEVFVQGNLEIRFTVSMGLAELQDNETADEILKRADTALYESKNTGRNKVTISGFPKIQKVA